MKNINKMAKILPEITIMHIHVNELCPKRKDLQVGSRNKTEGKGIWEAPVNRD